MKAFIAIPAYDAKLTASCAQSLLKAGMVCANQGIELQPCFIHGGIFIDNARSLLVKKFLKTDCTHLFFIDADIGFESDAIAGMVLANHPIGVGVYPKRDDSRQFNTVIHEPQQFKNGWIRLDRAATGFMCIRRDVLEIMSQHAPVCDLNQGGKTPMVFHVRHDEVFVGEDYAFCDDYNALLQKGVFSEPIWAYPDINFDHDGVLGNLHKTLSSDSIPP